MKEDNDTKVYPRSNFDFNRVINTGTPAPNPKIFNATSNNLPAKTESLNLMQDDNDSRNSCHLPEQEEPDDSQGEKNPPSDEEPVASSSASAGFKKRRKKMQRFQSQVSDFSNKCSAPSRINPTTSSPATAPLQSNQSQPALNREDRKNQQIIKMIERQEKLRMRREQKKQGIPIARSRGNADSESNVSNDDATPNTSKQAREVDRPSNGAARRGGVVTSSSGRVKPSTKFGSVSMKQQAQQSILGKKKPAVEITVVFSDSFHRSAASHMSRYFYERKHTLEERQRQEYGQPVASDLSQLAYAATQTTNPQDRNMLLQHCLLMSQSQEPVQAQTIAQAPAPYYQNHHQLNMHVHAGTGGPYHAINMNEDFSATSSFSSSSKRQKIDDYGGQFISHSVPQQKLKQSPAKQQLRSVSEECASVENNFEQQRNLVDDQVGSQRDQEEREMERVLELTRQLQKKAAMHRATLQNQKSTIMANASHTAVAAVAEE